MELFNEYLLKAKKVEDLDPAVNGLDEKLILNFMMFILKDLELIASSNLHHRHRFHANHLTRVGEVKVPSALVLKLYSRTLEKRGPALILRVMNNRYKF